MNKKQELGFLKKKMLENKNLPLRDNATQLVFGEGDPGADIYFLGEAPGKLEDITGRPFAGNSGKLLDKLFQGIGLKRDELYITSLLRFRPPGNRSPKPSEIAAFAPYVDKEIEIIDPKIIVTLGRYSMEKFLPDAKISKVHGKIFKINWNGKERIIMPMYHPAAGLRRKKLLEDLKEDFKKLQKLNLN